ncbi:MAG: hypothetical protein PHC51_10265 [bacterium]|nr:hypothetical protein [bacterium]
MMDTEQLRLEQLRDRMSSEQRQKMSQLISNELERREKEKTPQVAARKKRVPETGGRTLAFGGGGDVDAVREIYRKMATDKVTSREESPLPRRVVKPRWQVMLEAQRTNLTQLSSKGLKCLVTFGTAFRAAKLSRRHAFVLFICVLAIGRVVVGTGIVKASRVSPGELQVVNGMDKVQSEISEPIHRGEFSPAEIQLLQQLDARRSELDEQEKVLRAEKNDLLEQKQYLAEQLVELGALRDSAEALRIKFEKSHNERFAQLSGVYGSMPPASAAPLLEQLDNDTALALLERMPGKRMGQILGLMSPKRAIELTKNLSLPGRSM